LLFLLGCWSCQGGLQVGTDEAIHAILIEKEKFETGQGTIQQKPDLNTL
jgi:hypothetical protein